MSVSVQALSRAQRTSVVTRPRPVLDALVFRVGDGAVTRAEILRWAERFDPAFVARDARRTALGALDDEDVGVDEAEIDEAAAEFRYERDLEASETLIAWLTARGLTVEAWWEAVRQSVLERRFAGQALPPHDRLEDDADATEARHAALVVTDILQAATTALARRAAVAQSLGRWPPAAGTLDAGHDVLEAIWVPWRSALMTDDALRQAVARDRLAWLVLDLVQSDWPNIEAAREALSCVRYDARELEDVAREAHAPLAIASRLLADVPDALHDALLNAAPGEFVGPIELPPRWSVALVRAKRAASLDEPLVRAAAERTIESRAATPLVEQHVAWVEPGA